MQDYPDFKKTLRKIGGGQMIKRFISAILALSMVLVLVPFSVFATGLTPVSGSVKGANTGMGISALIAFINEAGGEEPTITQTDSDVPLLRRLPRVLTLFPLYQLRNIRSIPSPVLKSPRNPIPV